MLNDFSFKGNCPDTGSASKMTYIVSGGAINSTHSLIRHWQTRCEQEIFIGDLHHKEQTVLISLIPVSLRYIME